MKIYNTLTREKETFEPIEANKVKMYVCGPTVYDHIHIGNARPYVVFDAVRRYFEYKGFDVNFVQNFTDVDDKIIAKANKEGLSMEEISQRYIDSILEDTARLNVMPPTHSPRVTSEMKEIIKMIEVLIEKGFAYEKSGSVFFASTKFEGYGKLSNKDIEDLQFGSRIEIDVEKNSPSDFVLWKPKKEGEPAWGSPWGEGRPGWHIECSAMAKKYLGETIDIHAGGIDLVFPHHENEVAQSEAANEKPLANYWMHNGFININNIKMSKSKGNFFTLRDILKQYPADVVRFFILSSHYRSPINFSEELVLSAEAGLDRIKNAVANLEFIKNSNTTENMTDDEKKLDKEINSFITRFETAMDDDFNTADGVSSIFELVKFANINTNEFSSKEFINTILNTIKTIADVLGINYKSQEENTLDEEVESLIKQRDDARSNKDFATADEIRDKLNEMNVVLEDTPLGVKWSFKKQ